MYLYKSSISVHKNNKKYRKNQRNVRLAEIKKPEQTNKLLRQHFQEVEEKWDRENENEKERVSR